jgi:hypothetical protein
VFLGPKMASIVIISPMILEILAFNLQEI